MEPGAFICVLLAVWGACPSQPDESFPGPPPRRGELVERKLVGEPSLDYWLYVPRGEIRGAPVLVTVHGISRNARIHAESFAQLAERHGAVLLAPRFSSREFGDYQRLGRTQLGPRADRLLLRLVDHVAGLTGAVGQKILLFGYSGGAQFAHRFAMAHPERVAVAAVSSSGWYTFPDRERWYPYGIRASARLPGVRFEPMAFLQIPMLVTVGERDVKRGRSLRRARHLDRQQGRNRVERAQRWVEAMAEEARTHALPSAVELQVLGGVHHSFTQNFERAALGERVAAFLFAPEHLARLPGPDASIAFIGPREAPSPPLALRMAAP